MQRRHFMHQASACALNLGAISSWASLASLGLLAQDAQAQANEAGKDSTKESAKDTAKDPAKAWLGRTPELSGQTLDDDLPYSLQAERGKVVLVFFWSTACAVCRDKLPEFRANYAGWRGKGFQIVAVNTDARSDDVRRYSDLQHRLLAPEQRFPMLWRGGKSHRDNFGAITQVPTSFFLDRQGRVVKHVEGRIPPSLWDDVAELVLG